MCLDAERFELLAYFGQLQAEELLARVDLVDLLTQEMPMKLLLQSGCVVAEDHGVHVELEGHARIAQLTNTSKRLEPARHADLASKVTRASFRQKAEHAEAATIVNSIEMNR